MKKIFFPKYFFLEKKIKLRVQNAVAAIIIVDKKKILLQKRDFKKNIWYPGFWGLFGGAVNKKESETSALKRELKEEINWAPKKIKFFFEQTFNFKESKKINNNFSYRKFYVVHMSNKEYKKIVLHEGKSFKAVCFESILSKYLLTPYDSFVIFLYLNKNNILHN